MAQVRPLAAELAAAARAQLGEEPARLQADLQHLKDWLAKQPHLRARTDDQFLVAFLRGCKFSLERTKEKIDNYYTLRSALPEIYLKRDPADPEIRRLVKMGIILPLGHDAEGRRVFLMRQGAYDPADVDINTMFKMNTLMMDMQLMDDDALIVKGQVSVVDVEGLTVAHATQMSPTLMKKGMTIFQEGYPLRPKAFHYLNVNPIFETVFKIFKAFLKKKFQDRIYVHHEVESLYQTVPKELLPKEYGGNGGTIEEISNALLAKLDSYRAFFLEDVQFGADEGKRPGRPKTHDELFGIEGSFRPLDVD